jgi:hypothetical protein
MPTDDDNGQIRQAPREAGSEHPTSRERAQPAENDSPRAKTERSF